MGLAWREEGGKAYDQQLGVPYWRVEFAMCSRQSSAAIVSDE